MPAIIAFASPKGGAGKTTASIILGTELAQRGASVTLIDADPNHILHTWSKRPGLPQKINVIAHVTQENIVSHIKTAAATTQFVLIDLEGTASLLSSLAITMSNLVIIPVQGSQPDADQAGRQIGLIRSHEQASDRSIPYVILFTRTNAVIQPTTQRFIEKCFADANTPIMKTKLHDREAYRAILSLGGTLETLSSKGVGNLNAAIQNARIYTAEVIEILKAGHGASSIKQTPPTKKVA